MAEKPSAPPAAPASTIVAILVILGVNFTITGIEQFSLTVFVNNLTSLGS